MEKVIRVETISEFNAIGNHETLHPLVSVIAKERIFDYSKSVSEIAFELGFKYPQHFTRMFKQKVGQSPNKYRTLN